MTAEKTMRSNVLSILKKAGMDARPVENPVDPGFPDVEFIGGTCELKKVDHWPVRLTTPLRLEHYTKQQRVWHTRRWLKGGNVSVLLQVESEFLLFRAHEAAVDLGNVSRALLYQICAQYYPTLGDLRANLPYDLKNLR